MHFICVNLVINIFLQIAMSYWLYGGMQVDQTSGQTNLEPQFDFYNSLLGVSKEDYTVTFADPDGNYISLIP